MCSSAHGTFSRIDQMLGHRTGLDKFKKTEILFKHLSSSDSMKLEISCKKKTGKNTNTWRLNNMLLKSHQANKEIKEIKEEVKNTWRQMKMETQQFRKPLGYSKNCCKFIIKQASRYMNPYVYCNIISITKMWEQPEWLLIGEQIMEKWYTYNRI